MILIVKLTFIRLYNLSHSFFFTSGWKMSAKVLEMRYCQNALFKTSLLGINFQFLPQRPKFMVKTAKNILGKPSKKKLKCELFPNCPGPPPPSWNLNRNFCRKKFETYFDLFTHFTYKLYIFWYVVNVFSSLWLCPNWVHLKILPY